MQDTKSEENSLPTKCISEAKKYAKSKIEEIVKGRWEAKPMHGQYPERVDKVDVDNEGTHKCLFCASLKGQSEGFIVAAQNHSLATTCYSNTIINDGTNL